MMRRKLPAHLSSIYAWSIQARFMVSHEYMELALIFIMSVNMAHKDVFPTR